MATDLDDSNSPAKLAVSMQSPSSLVCRASWQTPRTRESATKRRMSRRVRVMPATLLEAPGSLLSHLTSSLLFFTFPLCIQSISAKSVLWLPHLARQRIQSSPDLYLSDPDT